MLLDDTGRPLPVLYAQVLADHVGYEASGIGGTESYWRGPRGHERPVGPKSVYSPGIYADVNRLRYYAARATFTLFLVSADPGGITCRMRGETIPDDDLFAIIARWAHLPYARSVSQALIEQADWLDEHPAYRGLKIAGQVASRRVAPGHHEVAP